METDSGSARIDIEGIYPNTRLNQSSTENQELSLEKSDAAKNNKGPSLDNHVSPLFHHIRPLVYSMCLFGILHNFSNVYSSHRRKYICLRAYSTLIVLIHWLNFLRMFGAYIHDDQWGAILFTKIKIHIWYLQCAMNASQFFLASFWFHLILSEWGVYSKKRHRFNCNSHLNFFRISLVFCFCAWSAVAINVVVVSLWIISNGQYSYVIGYPFYNESSTMPVWCKLLYIVFHVYLTASWIFPVFFFCAFCLALRWDFLKFLARFSSSISPEGCIMGDLDLEDFRQEHEEICHVTQRVDCMFSTFTLVSYVINIPLICMIINIFMMETKMTGIVKITHYYWLAVNVIYIALITVSGALLHAAVSRP